MEGSVRQIKAAEVMENTCLSHTERGLLSCSVVESAYANNEPRASAEDVREFCVQSGILKDEV